MSKKNFSGGLNSLLGAQSSETTATPEQPAKRRPGRPQTNFREITKTSQKGTQENETREAEQEREPDAKDEWRSMK